MDTPSSAQAIDSDDDIDWEEVHAAVETATPYPELDDQLAPEEPKHLEITIARLKPDEPKKKKGISHAERMMRIDCHKIHTICLLVNARVRNQWLNDPLLHARLMSLAPLALQNSFAMIHKSRVPDANKRGRLFESAVTRLAEWWSQEFFITTDEGHIRNITFEDVNKGLLREGVSLTTPDTVISEEVLQDVLDDDGEQIRNEKSLMKHALMQSGSRDTSAQLFTALCRALGIPSRLVVSLQSVPWQSNAGKPKQSTKKKGKAKAEDNVDNEEDEDMEEVATSSRATPVKSEKAKGKEKAKDTDFDSRSTSRKSRTRVKRRKAPPPPESSGCPVFWTEVFSRADGKWICVDPLRCIVNKRKAFDPTPASTISTPTPASILYPTTHPLAASSSSTTKAVRVRPVKQDNRMLYVVAFEEDGYGRDVTRRYAREFSSKVSKVQGGNGRKIWWEIVVGFITRPYRLLRDDVEDEELDTNEMLEPMPTTLAGFKDHPIYLLARHLKQTEALLPAPPDTPVMGNFRGEPVYPRSAVVSLKTPENWMRKEGRQVKEGAVAMKFIKVRAGTIGKQREIEGLRERLKDVDANSEGLTTQNGELMQGLYARHQTEPYVPEPVINGKVPKNAFGNVDLYVPSMLPPGGVHLPYKGVAKIARKLGVDYAEAVMGFEFKKRRAFPIVEGIVVAQENESLVTEAFLEAERIAAENAEAKKRERAIKRWSKLIQGLRIRERLKAQYGSKSQRAIDEAGASSRTAKTDSAKPDPEQGAQEADVQPIAPSVVTADDIVKPYHLPRDYLVHVESYPPIKSSTSATQEQHEEPPRETFAMHTLDADSDEESMDAVGPQANTGTVRTLQEMAEHHESAEPAASQGVEELGEVQISEPTPADTTAQPTGRVTRGGRRAAGKAVDSKKELSARRTKAKRKHNDSEDEAMFTEEDEDYREPKRTKAMPKEATAAGSTKNPPRNTRAKRKRDDSKDEIVSEEDDEGFEEPKRTRTSSRKRAAVSTPAPASTRVLRSRTAKGA